MEVFNHNLWYQVDSLRSVLEKIKEAPEFYETTEVEGIIESIGEFIKQLEQAL